MHVITRSLTVVEQLDDFINHYEDHDEERIDNIMLSEDEFAVIRHLAKNGLENSEIIGNYEIKYRGFTLYEVEESDDMNDEVTVDAPSDVEILKLLGLYIEEEPEEEFIEYTVDLDGNRAGEFWWDVNGNKVHREYNPDGSVTEIITEYNPDNKKRRLG